MVCCLCVCKILFGYSYVVLKKDGACINCYISVYCRGGIEQTAELILFLLNVELFNRVYGCMRFSLERAFSYIILFDFFFLSAGEVSLYHHGIVTLPRAF